MKWMIFWVIFWFDEFSLSKLVIGSREITLESSCPEFIFFSFGYKVFVEGDDEFGSCEWKVLFFGRENGLPGLFDDKIVLFWDAEEFSFDRELAEHF